MELSSNHTAYELSCDWTHFLGCDTNADAFPKQGLNLGNTVRLAETRVLDLPERVIFEGDFTVLQVSDFLHNSVDWPIMSKRMLEVLKSVGNFAHRAIPITVVDDSFAFHANEGDVYDSAGTPSPKAVNEGFIAVQLTEHLDIFNYEKSRYSRRSNYAPTQVIGIMEYVLNVPEAGFPPIFRVSAAPMRLFISGLARQALKDAGICGTAYRSLDNGVEEIDNPVPFLQHGLGSIN